MFQKLITLLAPVLVFLGLLALLIIAWYIALPLLLLFFIVSWFRAQQIRKNWENLFHTSAQTKQNNHRRKVTDENIIDADYEELDS